MAFGVTPKQYITADRLTRARRSLRLAEPSAQVSQIANDWGFSHLGRFARIYKQQFGELPSTTLRRTDATSRSQTPVHRQ